MKIAQIELAVANERESIKHLEEGLNSTLTNDAYFKEEINRIQNKNAYVTEIELKNYFESAIRQELTTCSLVKKNEGVYELILPLSDPHIFRNFLTKYEPLGEEYVAMFRQFKREIDEKQSIQMTFNQKIAYENNKILFVNMYHPIIQACLNFFHQYDNKSKISFCYALTSDSLLPQGNTYYMVVYQVNVIRKVLGVFKRMETLLPLLYSVNERRIIKNEEFIDHVFSRSQTEGIERNATNSDIETEMIQDMRYDFAEEISKVKKERMEEIKMQVESERLRNEKQTKEYYASVIENQHKYISSWESEIEIFFNEDEKRVQQLQGAIRLAKDRIKRYEKEKENRLVQIRDVSHIEMSENIISLNLIKII